MVDEATQATEPSVLIPLVKANKFILAGDHKQLPPTVLNREAQDKGLSLSLFERLLDLHGPKVKEILNVQYRMNKDIMDFVSEEFYGGQLLGDEEVKGIKLEDLGLTLPAGKSLAQEAINREEAVLFLDIAGVASLEESKEGSNSYSNKIEGELAVEIAHQLIRSGIVEEDIGVITPYKEQSRSNRQDD